MAAAAPQDTFRFGLLTDIQCADKLTGHFHAGGAVRSNGTSYVTLEGLVEAPPGSNAYAVVEVAPAAGTITVHGGGYATSRVLAI